MYMAFVDSFSKLLSMKFEPYKLLSGGLLSNLAGKYFGTNLTDAEREANAFTAQQNQEAMAFEERMADKQMAFQEKQAGTQWQRGVSDMLSAGLNPALAYGQGGASAMQGSSASGSAGSSVNPNAIGLSELFQLFTLPAQLKIMKEQAKNIAADTADKQNAAKLKGLSLEWNPKIWASEIGLRSSQQDKLASEVESILATAEGQRIYNEFSPALFESQLASNEVNRQQMIASIARIQAEIEHYAWQNEGIKADIGYKSALRVLTAAQTALTNLQSDSVSADVWRKQFENQFEYDFGFAPNTAPWSAITSFAGRVLQHGGVHMDKLFDFLKRK